MIQRRALQEREGHIQLEEREEQECRSTGLSVDGRWTATGGRGIGRNAVGTPFLHGGAGRTGSSRLLEDKVREDAEVSNECI